MPRPRATVPPSRLRAWALGPIPWALYQMVRRLQSAAPIEPYSHPDFFSRQYNSADTPNIAPSAIGYPNAHDSSGILSKFIP
jgi:hypothetical protein